jgi:hypothetical protein
MAQLQKVSKNNTVVVDNKNGKQVVLHQTIVVKFDDKKIQLNNGGWVTTTTAVRMNQASNEYGLGYYVSRKGGEMFASFKGETIKFEGPTLTLTR